MAKARYLVHKETRNLKFRIVALDRETATATLRGDTGVDFPMKLSEEILEKYGYNIVVVDEPDVAPATA